LTICGMISCAPPAKLLQAKAHQHSVTKTRRSAI